MGEIVLALAITAWLFYFKVACGGVVKKIPEPHWAIFNYIEYIYIGCFWVTYFILTGIPMEWIRRFLL